MGVVRDIPWVWSDQVYIIVGIYSLNRYNGHCGCDHVSRYIYRLPYYRAQVPMGASRSS